MSVQELVYQDQVLKIEYDQDPTSPREWDNLGKMVCGHRRYTLGDEQINGETPEEYFESKGLESKDVIALPLFLMDHSGISMCTQDYNDKWDSGIVGFIYTTKEKVKEEWNVKRISKKLHDKVIECLKSEVSTYSDYIEGNVYGYNLENKDGYHIDSCWGFFGWDLKENGIADHIPDFEKFEEI